MVRGSAGALGYKPIRNLGSCQNGNNSGPEYYGTGSPFNSNNMRIETCLPKT
nr:hypothetical protein [Acinetobacter baumannii]